MRYLLPFFVLLAFGCSKVVVKHVGIPMETIRYEKTEVHDTVTVVEKCRSENKVIRTIYFEFDSFKLSDNAKAILDNVNTSTYLEIVAHTCSIGTYQHNRSLRMQRGSEVYNYLFGAEKGNSIINYSEDQCSHKNKKLCRNVEIVSYE